MPVYTLYRQQKLPITMDVAWEFFSKPSNLNKISPPDVDFKILSDQKLDKMYQGQIITYTIKPVLNIPMYWMTEITHVKDREYFVDEQRFGPYAFWHHQHFFTEVPGGVLMEDLLHYKLPLGSLGAIAHAVFVKKKLEDIFIFRQKALVEMFGTL